MPLSDEERRVLDEIERHFHADPAVSSPSRAADEDRGPVSFIPSAVLVSIGLAITTLGFVANPLVAMAGATVLFIGVVHLLAALAERGAVELWSSEETPMLWRLYRSDYRARRFTDRRNDRPSVR
jgi:hypothetical protein